MSTTNTRARTPLSALFTLLSSLLTPHASSKRQGAAFVCALGLLLGGLCVPSSLHAQDSPAIPSPDSTAAVKKGWWHRTFKENWPDPKKAATLSLVLPGAGQLYNKRWWKVPLVYGAMGAMVYSIDYNTRNYRRFRDAYILALQGKPHEFSAFNLETDAIRRYRDQYDKRRQLSWIGLVAVHLLQAAEAFVDANLMQFDVSDDLSLRWRIGPIAPSASGFILPEASAQGFEFLLFF